MPCFSPGISSISVALTNENLNRPPMAFTQKIVVVSALGENIATPSSAMGQAFEESTQQLIAKRPDDINKSYPELL